MNNTNKIVALFAGGVLLIAVVVAVVSFRAFSQITEAAEARKHTFVLLTSADDLLSKVIDAETGQRGYFLTNDKAFLEPYLAVRDKISGDLKELRHLSLIIAAQKRLDALAPLIDSKLAYLSNSIELRSNDNMPAVLANMRGSKGKPLMDSIRVEMKGFRQVEEDALARCDAEFQSSVRFLFVVIVTISLLTLLFALLCIYFINRETQHRLKNLVHLETQHLLLIQEETNKQLQQANVTLQISEEKLAVTLKSIGDAVMTTDKEGRVMLLNSLAEQLTGWTQAEAIGRPVEEIFHIINEETRQAVTIPVRETLAHGTARGLANHTVLIARSGSECAIADSCAPIFNRAGQVIGAVLVFRNITEEYESREYAESIINTVREPLISLDQDLRVVSASRSFYQVFKVNPKETLGQLVYDLGNKQWDIPKLRELLENILPEKTTFDNYEVDHDFTTIGRRIMVLNARQIQRASGKERIILLAIEDITERREIENGLEKTRKELEIIKKIADEASEFSANVINTVREPLISLDQDLRVVTASRSFYEVFKVNPKETVGQLIYDLGNNQWDIPKLRELLETILPQKATFDNYEVEHDFSDIGRRIMLLNARQIERASGKDRSILLAIEDITERREIEKGLEKTRKELETTKISEDAAREYAESIINTVREPLISLDQDLRVVSASRSFYEVFKVNPKETVGQLIYDLGNNQWDIPKLRELLENILPQKATFDNYEVEHDFSGIGRRIMLLNARQIQRVLGKERIILLAIEDITKRREIEDGLKMAKIAAEAASQAKSEFLANMSHELRTPLNAIIGFSEVLYDQKFGPVNETQKDYLNEVLDSSKHLLSLINEILDLAKVESGKMELMLSNFPLKELLEHSLVFIKEKAFKHRIELSLDMAEELGYIRADERKVKQIVFNLISNAIKFTLDGGKIGINAKIIGPGAEVSVWDTGIGIAPEDRGKLFKEFVQLENTMTKQYKGSGLGLSLAKKLVELHGGKIWVESEGKGKGSNFKFNLPIKGEK